MENDHKIYALTDEDGFPLAFYDTEINASIPEGAVEITAAMRDDLLSDLQYKKIGGGEVVASPTARRNIVTWDDIRARRQHLLTRSDWTQLPDSPLSPEDKAAWTAYRQTLRDLPETYASPDLVVWPEQPE